MANNVEIILTAVDKASGVFGGLEKKTEGLGKKFDSLSEKAGILGTKMTVGVTLPIMALFGGLASAAMELESTEAKFNTVFAGMTEDASAFIAEFKLLTPLTTAQARGVAAGIQDLLVPMGFAREAATKLTGDFMPLIGALANFNNSTHTAEQVAAALTSALVGEYEPMRRLGVVTNKTAIDQRVLELGMAATSEEITDQMRALALHEIVTESSADAIKAYTKANLDAKTQMALAKVEIIDVSAAFGESLLPTIIKVTDAARNLVSWFSGLSQSQKELVMAVLGVVAAVGPLLLILAKLITAVKIIIPVVATLIKGFGLAVTAIKVVGATIATIVTGPIGALLAAGGLVILAFENMRFGWGQLVKLLKGEIGILDIFKEGWEQLIKPIEWVTGKIKTFIEWVGKIKIPDVLLGKSPSPFEKSLRGITKAMDQLNQRQFMPALAGGGAGAAAGVINNYRTYNLTANYPFQSHASLMDNIRLLEMMTP